MVDDPCSSALIIKAQAPVVAPAHVHLAIMMNRRPKGKSSPVCLPPEDRTEEPQTTLVGASTLLR